MYWQRTIALVWAGILCIPGYTIAVGAAAAKPSSDEVIALLKAGATQQPPPLHTDAVGFHQVGTGQVAWLAEAQAGQLLVQAKPSPSYALAAAASPSDAHHSDPHAAHAPASAGHDATQAKGHAVTVEDWAAKIGVKSAFDPPALKLPQRPAFGIHAAKATPIDAPQIHHLSNTLVYGFWAAACAVVLITLFIAYTLAHTVSAKGEHQRQFTLGAKLACAFGTMAFMIMLTGAVSVTALHTISEGEAEFMEVVADVAMIESLQRDVLNIEIATIHFLQSFSNKDLEHYTHYCGAASARIKQALDAIKQPEELNQIKQIDTDLKAYEKAFEQAVSVADRRNGVVDTQLTPSGHRVTLLLEAIIETAHHDGDLLVALEAAEALDHFALARTDAQRYLRTNNEADAHRAIQEIQIGSEKLEILHRDVKHPTRKQWLKEAEEGFAFYTKELNESIKLVHDLHDIVDGQLEVFAPKLIKQGQGLVKSIHSREEAIRQKTEEAAESTRANAVAMSIGAVIFAAVVSWLLIRYTTRTIRRVLTVLRAIADGDLTQPKLLIKSKDELGSLARTTDQMGDSLSDLILEVSGVTGEVAAAATQIAASSEEMAQGMNEQSRQVTQIASAIEQMSASVVEVARKSGEAANNAGSSGQVAEQGGQVVSETIQGMQAISDAVSAGAVSVSELGKRGEQIGQIIEVINDIADQTNLLALNAAIEAARAGEHGRGFAVVADEVRKLADRTTKATEEIGVSIKAIQTETTQAVQRMEAGTDQVQVGVSKASEAGQSLNQIVAGAREVAGMIQSIAAAAEQQSAASEEVSRNIDGIASVTRQATEGSNQAAQAAAQLSNKAEQLQALVSKFKTDRAKAAGEASGGGGLTTAAGADDPLRAAAQAFKANL